MTEPPSDGDPREPTPAPPPPEPITSAEHPPVFSPPEERPPPLLAFVGLIGLGLLAPVLFGSFAYLLARQSGVENLYAQLLGLLAGQAAGIGVSLSGLRRIRRARAISPRLLGIGGTGDLWPKVHEGLRLYGLSIAGLFLVSLLTSLLAERFEYRVEQVQIQRILKEVQQSPLGVVLFFLIAALGAPLYEELVFRGLLFAAMRNRFGSAATIGITAVLFTFMHESGRILQDPRTFPWPILYLGCLLGLIRERTHSVVPGMAVHALHNTLALLFTLLTRPAL